MYSPSGAVEQSKETRALTEDLLDGSRDKFLRSLAAQNKSLKELQQTAHSLDEKVHLLSNKVYKDYFVLSIVIDSNTYVSNLL